MHFRLLCIIPLIFLLTGCITIIRTVTREELEQNISEYIKDAGAGSFHHCDISVPLYYMGNKGAFNYFNFSGKTYRLHVNEYSIAHPFPLSMNEKNWVIWERYGNSVFRFPNGLRPQISPSQNNAGILYLSPKDNPPQISPTYLRGYPTKELLLKALIKEDSIIWSDIEILPQNQTQPNGR